MKTSLSLGAVFRVCAFAGVLCATACGGAPAHDPTVPENASAPSEVGAGSTATIDGAALYAANCASCHGDSKKHSGATEIHKAIDGDKGKMGTLKGLTAPQIDAIAAAK